MTGEADDLHRSPSIIFSLSPFAPQATKPAEPYSVNSLIRKTLTPTVPLHFGGKNISLIFTPTAIEGGQGCEGLCAGIRLCGGFSGDL